MRLAWLFIKQRETKPDPVCIVRRRLESTRRNHGRWGRNGSRVKNDEAHDGRSLGEDPRRRLCAGGNNGRGRGLCRGGLDGFGLLNGGGLDGLGLLNDRGDSGLADGNKSGLL